ncbi:MAG: acyltransferase family protein [Candidatus Lokiarchaeota archaeon]|nr:acyltransferase family protein [Candidatus Lokiarchaeota archaeon]
MERLKSIDIFRGLCMSWMFLGHLIEWWIRPEFLWLREFTFFIFDPIGASGFLFISGVSITLSYRNRLYRVEEVKDLSYSRIKMSYFLRAFFLLVIAMIYNTAIALTKGWLSWIWTWFVLMTAAFSLLIMWPLFNLSKITRILIGVIIWVFSQYLYLLLSPFQNQLNIQGIFYHIFYNDYSQDPLLMFFSFFLFGTVLGDAMNNLNNITNPETKRKQLKKKIIVPTSLISLSLISFGILLKFPSFLSRNSLSWLFYVIGIDLLVLMILIILEEYKIFKTKKRYRVFFYFSYYSFTVYLGHNFLYFIFYQKLDLVTIWIAVISTFLIFSLVLRQLYKKWGWKASLKAVLGKASSKLAYKIEQNKDKE